MRLRRYAVSLVGISLLLAACGGGGGGGGATTTPPAGGQSPGGSSPSPGGESPGDTDPDDGNILVYRGDDRQERLVEGARAEGSVVWYTSLAGPVVAALTSAFEAEYPGITVEVFRGEQTALVSRTVQELGANRIEADVYELTSDGALLLQELGVNAPFYTPHVEDVPERWISPGGDGLVRMVADRASYVGFAYNTELLDAADVPGTIEDLASDTLAGRLALPTSTTGVRFMGNVIFTYGAERGREILEQIAANDIRMEAVSGAALADMIAAGEVVASPGIFRNHALALADAGNPIEWVPLEPVTGNIGYVMIPSAATNPHAGLLFADFLLGPVGTQVKADLFYPPPHLDVDFEIWVPDENYDTALDYEDDYVIWQEWFNSIF